MVHPLFPTAVMLLIIGPALGDQARSSMPVQYGTMTFHQRIIIRVPRVSDQPPQRSAAPVPVVQWKERKANRCVPVSAIDGAFITGPEGIDLITDEGRRLRARFDDDCPAIDFYGGVYLRSTSDGLLCARRDVIRSRSGNVCRIEGFRELVPKGRRER